VELTIHEFEYLVGLQKKTSAVMECMTDENETLTAKVQDGERRIRDLQIQVQELLKSKMTAVAPSRIADFVVPEPKTSKG
jgi:hypothetical protein